MVFGSKLRSLREEKQIGLRELSGRLGYDRAYLSRVENNASKPSVKLIKSIGREFGISEEVLRIAAGKLPADITQILSAHTDEAVTILRDVLGQYHANGNLFQRSEHGEQSSQTKGALPSDRYLDQVIHGDCRQILRQLPASCVDLVVTSPPYADNRRRSYEGVPPDKYVAWFLPIAAELKRVLKPEGSFLLNIKERVVDGERHTYVLELIQKMRAQGWQWVEEYIWHKKNCYPGRWPNRFRDAWERCLHFAPQKHFKMFQETVMVPMGDWRVDRLKKLSEVDKRRDDSRVMSGFGKRIANWVGRDKAYPTNVLQMATECANRGHSAAFPVGLPEWFIRLFTQEGDIVLDPFIGSGTTALACVRNKRHFVGVELSSEFCKLANQRVAQERRSLHKTRQSRAS